MISKIVIVSATALLTLTSAYANDDDKRTDKQTSATFKAMDANRDERLTQNEVSGDPTLSQNFTALDRDADGYLNKKEYAAAAGKHHMNREEKEPRPY
jgi:Ca2+-binding EF-hand superfamily protein